MENATKALLIAASVLIAIILIAFGLKVLSSPMGTIDQVKQLSTSMEVSTFNSTFIKYEGQQSKSAVKRLLSLIATSNQQNNNRHISVNLSIEGKNFHAESAEDILNLSQEIKNMAYIKFGLDANGYVAEISISDNENNTGYYTIADLLGNSNVEPTGNDESKTESEVQPQKPDYQSYSGLKNSSQLQQLIQEICNTCSSYPVNLEVFFINTQSNQRVGTDKFDIVDDQGDLFNGILEGLEYAQAYNVNFDESSNKITIIGLVN